MKERITIIVLAVFLFLPFIFYFSYLMLHESWLAYATLGSFILGLVILLFLSIFLIYKRRELNLLNKLESFNQRKIIEIDGNYFCPNCKAVISKDTTICPKCRQNLH